MNTMCWNVYGLGSLRAIRKLRFILKQHASQIVFLMESKVDNKRMLAIRNRGGFPNGIEVSTDGTCGGLCFSRKIRLM